MNDKAQSALEKARQERHRGQHAKAIKRLEQAVASFPDEPDLYLDAVDACLECGEIKHGTHFLKTAYERFPREKERLSAFVREKLTSVHDPALARFAVENAVKLRNLDDAADLLSLVPEHTTRDLLARTRTKKQTLKAANHGGYSLRSEMVTNELMEALLSVRIGNLKEAMTALVQIIEQKPIEHEVLAPFLLNLDGTAKSGRVRFALAYALQVGGKDAEAIVRFLEAARMEPTIAALCADRLKTMRGETRNPAKLERALAETLLIKGDFDEAAAVLRAYLAEQREANKEVGREVMMLLKPFTDPASGINECTWVALEAATSLEQSNAALELLRPLHQRGGHTAQLLEWLEARANEPFMTTEMMVFHASLALDERRWEHAGDILRTVCKNAPAEKTMVLALVDKHKSSHPSLEALFRELSPTPSEKTAPAGEGDFEVFDKSEFTFGRAGGTETEKPADTPPPALDKAEPAFEVSGSPTFTKSADTPPPALDKAEPAFEISDGPQITKPADAPPPAPDRGEFGFEISDGPQLTEPAETPSPAAGTAGFTETVSKNPPRKPFTETREISFDDAGRTAPASTTAPGLDLDSNSVGSEPDLESLAEPEVEDGDEPAVESAVESGLSDAVEEAPEAPVASAIDESWVTNVAQKLYESGASTFFHIDDSPESPVSEPAPEPAPEPASSATEVTPAPEPSQEPAAFSEPDTAPAGDAPPAPDTVPADDATPTPDAESPQTSVSAVDIEDAYERFRRGELDRAGTTALMKRAIHEGRVEQMEELLSFQPENREETWSRQYLEAELSSIRGRPLPALDILARIDEPELPPEWKRRVWLKMAVCQRMVRDFGAANATLTRLVDAFPGDEDYARLLRTNFEQYVSEQSTTAVALEKTTRLD